MNVAPLLAALLTTQSIVVAEREPVVMLVITPKALVSATPTAQFLTTANAAFEARTGLKVISVEQAGIDRGGMDACSVEVRFSCWLRALGSQPYLLMLSVHPGQDRDRLTTVFLDTKRARLSHTRGPNRSDEEYEAAVFETAVRAPPAMVSTHDESALRAYFESLIEGALRSELDRGDVHGQPGAIQIDDSTAGLSVEIDGRTVGATRNGTTRIEGLRAGTRRLVIASAQDRRLDVEVVVRTEQTSVVPLPPTASRRHGASTATYIASAAFVITGAALTAVAFARAGDGVDGGCLVRRGDTAMCDALGQVTFGYDASRAPTTDPNAVNPGGVSVGALGASMMTVGATFGVGAWLEDSSRIPWMTWLIGLAAGAGAYGITVAVGP